MRVKVLCFSLGVGLMRGSVARGPAGFCFFCLVSRLGGCFVYACFFLFFFLFNVRVQVEL